jgi:hypothetical protein
MRLLKTIMIFLLATVSFGGTASALVTVDATTTAISPVHVGDTIEVDILVSWDGSGSLIGIFSSHAWDNTQLKLLGAVFPLAPSFEASPILFRGGSDDPVLGRLGTISSGIFGDDLTSTARTVQYGNLSPPGSLNGATSAATNELVTRLTYQVIGGIGEGPVEINGAILLGDTGASGDSFTFGSTISLVVVPEPGVGLMLGLGLAIMSASRRNGHRGPREEE